LREEGQQVRHAEIDDTHSHWEHRVYNGSQDAREPGMRVPQNKRQIDSKANATCDSQAVGCFLDTILAIDHDQVERDEEPGDLLARQGQAEEDGGAPAMITQQPDQRYQQGIKNVQVAANG